MVSIKSIKIAAYQIPTDYPESDGTAKWDSTTMIVVWLNAADKVGIGYTYGHASVFQVIKHFESLIVGANAFEGMKLWEKMLDAVRNMGSSGIAAHAISAVDIALWDLKAKLLNVSLCNLWGRAREKIAIYGSGGFTSYTEQQLISQFEGWKKLGISKFKMKVGRHPDHDLQRVNLVREIIGNSADLFADANGAYSRKEALKFAFEFAEKNVCWFEEPVSSDDLEGLNLLRNRAPATINISAGEYGYRIFDFKKILEAQAVDVLQADASRCLGYTGFFQVCDLCRAFSIPLSSHTAPSLHLHPCLTQRHICHMEFFHDHVRIEEKYFDGFPKLSEGNLYPHLDRPGHGLELKESEINQYLILSA